MIIEVEATKEPTLPLNTLHIAWTAFQRRQVSMAAEIGFECVFLPIKATSRFGKVLSYLKHSFLTLKLLRRRRPKTVWLQLPQVPLLWTALLYRAIFDRNVKIVADCHNAMFRPPWSRFPLGLSLLWRCECVLVHNKMVSKQALALGIPAPKILVLEDVPPHVVIYQAVPEPECMQGRARPWVVFPGSFAADEPIAEFLEAANLLPDVSFVITGNIANAKKHGHVIGNLPSNVVLPGFLPLEQFDNLLRHADVIMGLTKIEGIQLSVCNEAYGFGKPLIVSDTVLLRQMFSAGAAVVNSTNPQAIVQVIIDVLHNLEHYQNISCKQATNRRREWKETQLAGYERLLGKYIT